MPRLTPGGEAEVVGVDDERALRAIAAGAHRGFTPLHHVALDGDGQPAPAAACAPRRARGCGRGARSRSAGSPASPVATIAGSSPAASSLQSAALTPRNPKSVKTSRPPGARWAGAPAITRSSSAQPSGPPLSAVAAASSRSRPGGVGIWGGLVQIRSKVMPAHRLEAVAQPHLDRSATPLSDRVRPRAAHRRRPPRRSRPPEHPPARPAPRPGRCRCRSRAPGSPGRAPAGAGRRASEPALGGCAPSSTVKVAPSWTKSSTPASPARRPVAGHRPITRRK